MRKQFLIAVIPADGAKQVERAVSSDQIQMAGGGQMTFVGLKATLKAADTPPTTMKSTFA